jgi:Homeodomain-like domain-containing protein
MVHPVQVRPISNDEGMRLLRIVRRGTGSVVTWRRAQMVLLSAQGMPVARIAEVTFTSLDRVRDVLHNFTADGFRARAKSSDRRLPCSDAGVERLRSGADSGRRRERPTAKSL